MHPHRSSALGYASAASAAHSRVYGACAAEVAASESSGLSVGGCIRARGYFGPHPVYQNNQTKVIKSEKDVLGMGRHERIRKRESPVHTLDFP
jgi:hypothetical protein